MSSIVLDAMKQKEQAEKWALAQKMMPVLRKSFIEIVPHVDYDDSRFDFIFDAVENYLPKTVSMSDLPEAAQVEILSMMSLTLRQKEILRDRRRRKQLIGLTVGIIEFGVRALEALGTTVRGIPIRQYFARTNTPVVVVDDRAALP